MSFQDKVAIVTGASSGIGAAIAIALSAEGASVAIVGRNQEKLAATADRCAFALPILADITNDSDARRIINETVGKYGKIDILVNNAGSAKYASVFDDDIMAAYDFTINVNLRAVFRLTSLAIPYLLKTKGNIVMMSSVAGQTALLNPESISYSVSKAALNHFSTCLAADLAPHGIRVNSISPGPVETDFMINSGLTSVKWDDFKSKTALGTIAGPRDVANLVLFLVSDRASFITGSSITCDNGWTIKRN